MASIRFISDRIRVRKITDTAIISLAQHCRQLTTINLHGCRNISDTAIVSLAEHCRQLTTIDLQAVTNITNTAVIALAELCQMATISLSLSFCYNSEKYNERSPNRENEAPRHQPCRALQYTSIDLLN